MIVAPVIAVFVGTVIWRVMMPDEPDPSYGVIAGAVTAARSLFVFAASIGLMVSMDQFSAGALVGGVSEFVFITTVITVFGGLIIAPVVTPLGALVGYSCERHIVGGQT